MKTVDEYVNHILWLKSMDIEYARHAIKWYDEMLPWIDIKQRIREAMNEKSNSGEVRNP